MPHHKFAYITFPMFVLFGCASEPPRSLAARVTEYGIYQRGTETIRRDSSIASGQIRDSTGLRLKNATQLVPLHLGESFGFCYEVTGFDLGARPTIVIKTEHPKFSRPGEAPTTMDQKGRNVVPVGGVINDCTGYGFDHQFELVPGNWQFTVIIDGRPILTQTFVAQ